MEQNRYDNYLQSALSMASNEQSLGEQISSQISAYQTGKNEASELGTELSLTSLPGIIPAVKNVYTNANKLYKSFNEIAGQSEKVVNAVKTIPSDVSKLFGSKVDKIKSLVQEGSAESISKAKGLYSDLQKTVNESAKSGKTILNNTTSQLQDIGETSLKTSQSLVSNTTQEASNLANATTNNVSNIANLSKEELQNKLNENMTLQENINSDAVNTTLKSEYDAIKSRISTLSNEPSEVFGGLVRKRATSLNYADTLGSRAELGSSINLERSIKLTPFNGEAPNIIGSAKVGMNKVTGLANETANQATELVNQTAGKTSELANQTVSQASELANQTATQAKTALTEGAEQTRNLVSSTVSDLATTGNEAKDLVVGGVEKVASVFEKTSLSDLPELLGVSSLPIVGEALGLAGLVTGAVEGIKDMFASAKPAPVTALPVQASIVHQAGI
jgi:hypothetical protein